MKSPPPDFNKSQARYIGSLERNNELCHFYELLVEGSIQYIYVPAKAEEGKPG